MQWCESSSEIFHVQPARHDKFLVVELVTIKLTIVVKGDNKGIVRCGRKADPNFVWSGPPLVLLLRNKSTIVTRASTVVKAIYDLLGLGQRKITAQVSSSVLTIKRSKRVTRSSWFR